MITRHYSFFLYASAALAASVFCSTTVLPDIMKLLFSQTTYFLILAMFLTWLHSLGSVLRQKHRQHTLKDIVLIYREPLIAALFFSIMIFCSVGTHYRVLSDETNLLGDAKSMFDQKSIDNVTMGEWYYNSFYPIHHEIPKRPLFYPFLISLVHTAKGYSAENGFLVNFLLLTFFLGFIYYLVQKKWGRWCALSSLLLVCAQPVFTQSATSSGFDFAAVFFITISFIALRSFLDSPDPVNFRWLWINLMVLGNVRHESFLFFLVSAAVLFAVRRIKLEYFSGSPIYGLTPFFMLPVAWQRWIHRGAFEADSGIQAWSPHHIGEHTANFLKTLVRWDFVLPYANLINLAAVLLLFLGAARLLRRGFDIRKNEAVLTVIAASSMAALWLILTSFHRGNTDHPTDSRYFTPFAVLFSMVLLSSAAASDFFRKRRFTLAIISLGLFLLYHPIAAGNRFTYTQTLPRSYVFVLKTLEKTGVENPLVISDRPGLFTVRNYGALNFQHANLNKRTLLNNWQRHLYPHVYVVQEMLYEKNEPAPNNRLDPEYRLETVAELQNTPASFIRISKVVKSAADQPGSI